MSFRKELKYSLKTTDYDIIKARLLQNGARILFPERRVISQYFDTLNLRMFQESDEGILPRRKIRIRQYSDSVSFFKEVKISSHEGRFKVSSELNQTSTIKPSVYNNLFDLSYGAVFHSATVEYSRSYLKYGSLRLTLDRNIKYSHPTSSKIFCSDNQSVLEVKTASNTSDDYIESLTNMIPERFSKYCRAIEFLNLSK